MTILALTPGLDPFVQPGRLRSRAVPRDHPGRLPRPDRVVVDRAGADDTSM
jgi:hypothetical protein